MAGYSLQLSQPVLVGPGFLASLNDWHDWKRSIRMQGGFWQGSCWTTGDAADLLRLFNTWLGYHVEERAGGVISWEGLVYELEITIGGAKRRRSLDDLWNAVACTYQSGGEVATSAYSTQAQSIARYGRREEVLTLDNYPVATAQAYRASFLAENCWPWPRPLAIGAQGEARLDLVACGYAFTANWQFVEEGDGTSDDVDDWLIEVAGTAHGLSSNHGGSTSGAGDCQFLKTKNVAANTLQAAKECQSPTRAWDLMAEIAALGDASGNPWQVWVDAGRVVNYNQISASPRYYMRQGVLYDTAGGRHASNPWLVRPAVVRDLDYPVSGAGRGLYLADNRDSFVEEVEVASDGTISLRTVTYLREEVLGAQYAAYTPPEEER